MAQGPQSPGSSPDPPDTATGATGAQPEPADPAGLDASAPDGDTPPPPRPPMWALLLGLTWVIACTAALSGKCRAPTDQDAIRSWDEPPPAAVTEPE